MIARASVAIGLAVVTGVLAVSLRGIPARVHEAGFWFEDAPLTLTPGATAEIGGAITDGEAAEIRERARAELRAAFSGFPIAITDRRDAFWRVSVTTMLPQRRRTPFPAAGETWALGRFGGHSHVSFRVLAHAALSHAPAGAPRAVILHGIARGIGRTAAHELAHAILGPSPVMDTRDGDTYEHHSFARPNHYYGELRWAGAREKLLARLAP